MKILVLGASGMLGNAALRVMDEKQDWEVFGTVRSASVSQFFSDRIVERLIAGCDVENHDALVRVLAQVRPNVVINCIGLIKQLADAGDPLQAIPINSLLPHRLARLCGLVGARLVHISTDCVFSGARGGYQETDFPDANDLYGRSKLLGEVDYPHAITLRTSMIGHELTGNRSLIGWFLGQQGSARGFTRAIFSGLPTVELSRLIRDVVISRPDLHGLYHVGVDPITKHDLLHLVAKVYDKSIKIVPDDTLIIDRSLDSTRFCSATGYTAPQWPELVRRMHSFG